MSIRIEKDTTPKMIARVLVEANEDAQAHGEGMLVGIDFEELVERFANEFADRGTPISRASFYRLCGLPAPSRYS